MDKDELTAEDELLIGKVLGEIRYCRTVLEFCLDALKELDDKKFLGTNALNLATGEIRGAMTNTYAAIMEIQMMFRTRYENKQENDND